MELDRIKLLLCELALSHGLTDADLRKYNQVDDDFEWHIDWSRNLTEEFRRSMQLLEAALDLYDSAMSRGDKLTAKAGLIRAGIRLQTLENFFASLTHDVKKAYSETNFNWPDFPSDSWKIPGEYNFKDS
ncbi:hypothetical protein [Paraburkholderia sp. ZP32-5]|uniref:hypothetical protein n=1 Tax=Paraburkholderia sp. ZP32-5 TaxID=2883245 RepID=UPI001F2E8ED6|nr:hypothetical protein [Paraburkholderia sp. ZP32-5]